MANEQRNNVEWAQDNVEHSQFNPPQLIIEDDVNFIPKELSYKNTFLQQDKPTNPNVKLALKSADRLVKGYLKK